MNNLPTLLLVHGAWHTPACWSKIITPLTSRGFKCIAPQLHHSGDLVPVETIIPDVHLLQSILTTETSAGNDVVVIAHSFGGMAGCSAVKGFTKSNPSAKDKGSGSVIGIILLTALVPQNGISRNALAASLGVHVAPVHKPDPAGSGWQVMTHDPADVFYSDLPASEAAELVRGLKKQSALAFNSGAGVYGGWAEVEMWYLLCEEDQCIALAAQERMVEIAREKGGKVVARRVRSGHSPFLSRVAGTVGFVAEAVERFTGPVLS